MKKILSIIIVISLMMSSLGTITASAIIAPEDALSSFDINQYTIYDLIDMSTEERRVLLSNFIETYNPYGVRDLMEESNITEPSADADLQWSSDANIITQEQELATHQIVTLEAFARYVEMNGFYDIDGIQALVVALTLAAASGLPDIDETEGLFKAHFYDPDTKVNFVNESSPTAKTRTGAHYYDAWYTLQADDFVDVTSDEFIQVLESLGRALHYLQDLCEPHHASNKTALNSNHSVFELHVENNIESYIENIPEGVHYYLSFARENTASDLAHYAATIAKPKYDNIKLGINFEIIGYISICESVYFSEALIYKLFYECSTN